MIEIAEDGPGRSKEEKNAHGQAVHGEAIYEEVVNGDGPHGRCGTS